MSTVNPYAAPQSWDPSRVELLTDDAVAWRDGKLLVIDSDARLPPRCIKCNAPAEGPQRKLKLSQYSPLAFLGLLLGPLIFLLIALLTRRTAKVHVSLCAAHKRRRLIDTFIACGTALAGCVLLYVGAAVARQGKGLIVLAALLLIVVSLIGGSLATRLVWPKRIEKGRAWLHGCATEFLAGLPEYPF